MYIAKPKIEFDPYNVDHLDMYNKYLQTKRWGLGCPFHLEWPYANIPVMIERKIIDAHMKDIIANASCAALAKTIKHPKKL